MYTVVLSAGHSPKHDYGAVQGAQHECDLVLDLRDSLRNALQETGEVRVISVSDEYTLRETIKFSKGFPHDIALEIHLNSFDDPKANGVEVLYKRGDTEMLSLASSLALRLSQDLGLRNRGAKDDSKGAHMRLGFLQEIDHGIIIEAGFLSHPEDITKVFSDVKSWGSKVAEVIIKWLHHKRKP